MLPPRNYSRRTRDPHLRSRVHRDWVKGHYCLIFARKVCDEHGCDPHHVRTVNNAAGGVKPSDLWCVPICRAHHTELHNIGQPEFERRYAAELEGMTLAQKALEFSRGSPDRAIREAVKEMRKA